MYTRSWLLKSVIDCTVAADCEGHATKNLRKSFSELQWVGSNSGDRISVQNLSVTSPSVTQVRRAESGRSIWNKSAEISHYSEWWSTSSFLSHNSRWESSQRENTLGPKRSPRESLCIHAWLMPQSLKIPSLFPLSILHYFLILHNADVNLHKCLNFLSSCQAFIAAITSENKFHVFVVTCQYICLWGCIF